MRLIDADELPEVNTIERIEDEREVFVNSWVPASAIWKAPTVEAIPVEWIKEWFSTRMNSTLLPRNYEMVCNWLIYDWEKENEID